MAANLTICPAKPRTCMALVEPIQIHHILENGGCRRMKKHPTKLDLSSKPLELQILKTIHYCICCSCMAWDWLCSQFRDLIVSQPWRHHRIPAMAATTMQMWLPNQDTGNCVPKKWLREISSLAWLFLCERAKYNRMVAETTRPWLPLWQTSMKNDELVDYNEVVENDEAVKEIETRVEVETNVVNVSYGDHASQPYLQANIEDSYVFHDAYCTYVGAVLYNFSSIWDKITGFMQTVLGVEEPRARAE
ncbi:hypothetical protein Tco_0897599 [Tanacetum coccineum]